MLSIEPMAVVWQVGKLDENKQKPRNWLRGLQSFRDG
jgi:hypothetical protein